MDAVCENCAGEDDDLEPVWPLPAGLSETPQLWCEACRRSTPNEPAEDEDEDEAGNDEA